MAQSVVFEAAVPFSVPFWAIIRTKYREYAKFVLFGSLAGCFFLGFGQVLILALQILLYECIMRFRYWQLPQSIAVSLAVLLVQIMWQGVMYQGLPPVLVQFYVGCEAALALIMTLFMQVLFVNSYEWFTTHWTYEKLGSGLVVFAAMLTGMQTVVISYFHSLFFTAALYLFWRIGWKCSVSNCHWRSARDAYWCGQAFVYWHALGSYLNRIMCRYGSERW